MPTRTPTDPARLLAAEMAADAQSRQMTKAAFQLGSGLSAPKALEAWKDADVLFGDETRDAWAAEGVE